MGSPFDVARVPRRAFGQEGPGRRSQAGPGPSL